MTAITLIDGSIGVPVRVADLGQVLTVTKNLILAAAVGPNITAPGSLSGTAFRIGTPRTITAGTATASGGGTVTYGFRWVVNGSPTATTAAYTPLEAGNGQSIEAQWQAIETGGTNPGSTAWQTVGTGTITYNAPVAGTIADRTYTQGTGTQTVNAALAFTVTGDADLSGVTWAIVTGPAGVTINSAGVVSIPTTALLSAQTITVRATNSGAPAGVTASFAVTVAVATGAFSSGFSSGFQIAA